VDKIVSTHAAPLALAGNATVLDVRQQAALEKLQSLLTAGETLQQVAFQLRIHALLHRRVMIVTTDRRVIVLRRRLFGGFEMQDFQWQDVQDARINERFLPDLLGADLEILAYDGRRCGISGAASTQLRAMYAYAQTQEQAWREKHRVRKMEELRAQAGGVTIGAFEPGAKPNSGDIMAKLREAKALLDDNTLSDVEYETLKAKILAGHG
jgi:uncharacterized protein YoaH (UPF0181 family)